MDTESATQIKAYADRFITALERIASALEANSARQGQRDKSPVSDIPTGASAPPAPVSPISDASTFKEYPRVAVHSFAQVKAAIFAYQDSHGAAAAEALLKEFDAKYIGQLKPEQYADVMAKVS
jgi:hypothetical protein